MHYYTVIWFKREFYRLIADTTIKYVPLGYAESHNLILEFFCGRLSSTHDYFVNLPEVAVTQKSVISIAASSEIPMWRSSK